MSDMRLSCDDSANKSLIAQEAKHTGVSLNRVYDKLKHIGHPQQFERRDGERLPGNPELTGT